MLNPFYLCMVFSMLSSTPTFSLSEDARILACNNAQNILLVAYEEDIDPFILSSLIYHESRFVPKSKSPAGACGLTQVMSKYVPETCEQLMNNQQLSIQTGAVLLKTWLRKKNNSYYTSLQCYASGYKCKHVPYAKKIIARADKLKKLYTRTKRRMQNALY
tara:strand:- start:589 stop:1071 length:483 start_codon:yes stop_codon:yes gene_type:complete